MMGTQTPSKPHHPLVERLRREAELVEQVARSISLRPDKEALFTNAQSLRRHADEVEARSTGCPDEQAAPPRGRLGRVI